MLDTALWEAVPALQRGSATGTTFATLFLHRTVTVQASVQGSRHQLQANALVLRLPVRFFAYEVQIDAHL